MIIKGQYFSTHPLITYLILDPLALLFSNPKE
jgi:hypothetical protein